MDREREGQDNEMVLQPNGKKVEVDRGHPHPHLPEGP